jgi:hypothetical protein
MNSVNKALDMGWRIRLIEDTLVLVPPDGKKLDGPLQVYSISVPTKALEGWIIKHTVISPDEDKRNDLKAKIINFLNLEWANYVIECDGDEEWAQEIIISDAYSDYGADKDDIKEWLDEIIILHSS